MRRGRALAPARCAAAARWSSPGGLLPDHSPRAGRSAYKGLAALRSKAAAWQENWRGMHTMGTQRTHEEPDRPAQDLLLLLSMLGLILVHPLLDHVIWGRVVLGLLTFVPLVVALVRMSDRKGLVWPFAALLGASLVCAIAAYTLRQSHPPCDSVDPHDDRFRGERGGTVFLSAGCDPHHCGPSVYGGEHLPAARGVVLCSVPGHCRGAARMPSRQPPDRLARRPTCSTSAWSP